MRHLFLGCLLLLGRSYGQAIIDHVEVHEVAGVPTLATIHIASALDWAACVASATVPRCQHITSRVYLPEEAAEPIEDELAELERDFRYNVAKEIDAEVNKLPPCYVPPVCAPVPQPLPIPEPTCVATRVSEGLAKGLAKYQPQYWLDVTKTMYEHLPNTIAWTAPLPVGVLFAPIFSVEPKLGQYFEGYSDDPRERAYMANGAPPHLFIPIAITPEEGDVAQPGVNPLEGIKRGWAAASYLEYQNWGFSSFYQLSSEIRPVLFTGYDVFPPTIYPGIRLYCTLGIVPYVPLPIKLPLPIIAPVPMARVGVLSVPEGYEIPHTEGRPYLP
jgi:hypothetical protein